MATPALIFRAMSSLHTAFYRATGGAVGGAMKGAPILLLTTSGRKSGKRRVTPLLYLRDGDDLVVVASKGGAPKHPAWYLNLRSAAEVEARLGRTTEPRRARTASPEERERLWPMLVGLYPGYAAYQEQTSREIPVVILERPGAAHAAPQSGN